MIVGLASLRLVGRAGNSDVGLCCGLELGVGRAPGGLETQAGLLCYSLEAESFLQGSSVFALKA